jgi:hypothetical protein
MHFQIQLNFTAVLSISIDGKFGGPETNGTWNGMMGMLLTDQTDLVTSPLSQTLARSLEVDFTNPLEREIVTLITAVNKGQAQQFWVYTDIFTYHTWLVCTAMILVVSLAFCVIDYSGVNSFHIAVDSEKFTILNSLSLTALLLVQLGYNVITANMSSRILFFITGISTYVIYNFYTSDLTARMTSGPPDIAINSFQDVIDQSYTVLVLEASSNQEYLRTAKSNTPMHQYYHSSMEGKSDAFVTSNQGGKDGMLTKDKTLLFGSLLSILADKRFNHLKTTDTVYGHIGWALQKNSELTSLFSYHLGQLEEGGILFKMRHNYTYQPSEEFTIPEAIALGYDNTLFPFLVLFFTVPVAGILLICECLKHAVDRCSKKPPNTNTFLR